MADKVEFEFELQGLKIKFKGDRSELPAIGTHLGNQIAGMLESGSDLAAGQSPDVRRVTNTAGAGVADETGQTASAGKKGRRRKRRAGSEGGETGSGSGSLVVSQVDRLVADGYFSEERTLGDIKDHLKVSGYTFESSDLSPVLVRSVRAKQLSRRQDEDKNQYVYWRDANES